MNATADQWFTRQQAADYLHVSLPVLDRFRRAGEINDKRLGPRLVRIARSELDEFMRACPDGAL